MRGLMLLLGMFRPLNLLILGWTGWTVFFVLSPQGERGTDIQGWLAILATLLVCAFGYLINDYYDLESDRINKPAKVAIGNVISARMVLFLGLGMGLLGSGLGFYIGGFDNWIAMVPLSCALAVWAYSRLFQHHFLAGNMLVSLLSAVSLVYPAGIGDWLYGETYLQEIQLLQAFVLFAFLATLCREIAKDMEDVRGDAAVGAATLAIRLGKSSKWVILGLLFAHLIPAWSVTDLTVWETGQGAAWTIVLMALFLLELIVLFYFVVRAKSPEDYKRISLLFKVFMLFGIFAFYQLALRQ